MNAVIGLGHSEAIQRKNEAASFLVDCLAFPSEELERPVQELSYARRRLVELGKAFVTDRPIVLLDEPTAGLSEPEQRVFAQLIRILSHHKIVLLVEHNHKLLGELADEVLFMKDGNIALENGARVVGSYEAVLRSELVREAYLGRFKEGPAAPRISTVRTKPILEASVRSAGYSIGSRVLRDVRVTIHEGEILAIIGPNGSGKTTLFRCFLNSPLMRALDGTIRFWSRGTPINIVTPGHVGSLSTHEIARRGIILVRQEGKGFSSMTAMENLLFAANGLPMGAVEEETLVLSCLSHHLFTTAFGKSGKELCNSLTTRQMTQLSGGQQQLIAIARAVIAVSRRCNPVERSGDGLILLLDEPTAGLQPSLVASLFSLLDELRREHNITIVIAEQGYNLEGFADRVVRMENGRLTCE